ncbi:MAG: sulfotransferase domain-containing protein [Burkholderiales bacterium]|jgi:aryl sulfotransferase|nr:sulfotransferase domain-containing protein [Burkholderiales bacterium]
MKILQIGKAKSGNYWLYNILRRVCESADIQLTSFIKNQPIYEEAKNWCLSVKDQAEIDVLDITKKGCYYGISSAFRQPILDIDDYIDKASLVWSHSTLCNFSNVVLPKFNKIVYIIRDPRDVAISASKFAFTPYMKKYYPSSEKSPESYLNNILYLEVMDWILHVGRYIKHKDNLNIHVIFYERLLNQFPEELRALLEYLEVNLDQKSIDAIQKSVSFKNMSKGNSNHVRRGDSQQWVEILTDNQKRRVNQIAKPMLELLNYPTEEEVEYFLPSLPIKLNGKEIDKMLFRTNMKFVGLKVFRRLKSISQSAII